MTMGQVVNLNRFRKKKAREEKARRAETNRRLHGRTKAERAQDALDKKQLQDKLDGAFLLRERVDIADIPGADPEGALEALDRAAERAIPLSDLSRNPPKRDDES
jgi:hypothetical protein